MYTKQVGEKRPLQMVTPWVFCELMRLKQERNHSVTYSPTKDSMVIESS